MTMLGPVQVEGAMELLPEIPTAQPELPVATQPVLPAVPPQDNEKK